MARLEEPVQVGASPASPTVATAVGERYANKRACAKPFPAEGATAPIRRERLSLRIDAEHVFEALFAEEPYAFWLDAPARDRGTTLLGAASSSHAGILVAGGVLHRVADGIAVATGGTIEDAVRSWRAADGGADAGGAKDVGADAVRAEDVGSGFRRMRAGQVDDQCPLGWIGWFGYEHGARLLGVPGSPSPYPDVALMAADRVIEIDEERDEVSLWYEERDDAAAWVAATSDRLRAMVARLRVDRALGGRRSVVTDSKHSEEGSGRVARAAGHWQHTDAEYLEMIAACQTSIRAGDAYQLCLTTTVSVPTDEAPWAVFRRVREASHPVNGGFVRFGDVALLSASPELFLTVRNGVAATRPVKGTRPRGATPAEDDALRNELALDEKECAENLMIVDLMRNDLARVSRLGGVAVTELLAVETHKHVHQLVSTVRARLADGVEALDVLNVCFPAGSMTGVPKLSAMGILARLEGAPRGVYSGCFGRLGLDGSAELAMVIRSIIMAGGTASVGTGGGITALSEPERELAEVKLKAAALLRALRAQDG